ncbi:MAG: GPW/gp25 family protein [Nitrosomonadaceae bacterium]
MPAKIKPGEEFLGIGLVGPLTKSPEGDFETKAGAPLVAEAWKAILSTQRSVGQRRNFIAGERFMRDDFGTNIKSLKHMNMDDDMVAFMEAEFVEALEKHEARAVVSNIRTEMDEVNQVTRTFINGTVIGSNDKVNLVIIRDSKGKLSFSSLEGA